ncbi:hypothetical protein [Rhodopseudomonas sp. B29]|uniref:hypothetical protein n=1 Tax=Rhodopseudomonas sp. B29 TaxID=95607 RepID=UPI0003494B67|nr:hypothetical protein [Rhodopseudomonas sp. B29]
MLARIVFGAALAGAAVLPAMAGSMSADEARKFVAGKIFAFNCFDGTRGAGRIFDDGGAAGSIQFSGSGPTRFMRVPGNTLQVRGESICASLKGIPFEPCFNLNKTSDRSFRGSVSGMGFAYCDFRHQGRIQLARAISESHSAEHHAPRSLRAPGIRSADATPRAEVTASVPVPKVESAKLEPPKADSVKAEAAKVEAVSELRRSTD